MNKIIKLATFLALVALFLCERSVTFADTIEMSNGQTFHGTVIQTNGTDVLLLTHYAAFDFSKSSIRQITAESAESTASSDTTRLPPFQQVILCLSQQPWATGLTPIPATVIDKGILKSVPYTSFRCAGDYEVNVYGDLDNPAGIEIGVYRKLLGDTVARSNCVNFISGLLKQDSDKKILLALNLDKDLMTSNDLTFEITPPTADDAYGGWWVSVYSESQLNLARASDKDMDFITVAKANAAEERNNFSSWSANELDQARPSRTTISFVTPSGEVIHNAEVVRVIDGVSLIWRSGPTSGGLIRLADLPEDLRARFGYDPAKTKVADDLMAANKAKWQQEANAAAAQSQYNSIANDYPDNSGSYSAVDDSGGGSVYVHGYYRSNGTYVNPYSRSYPHSRY
jgi:hypothetical protein